MSPESLKKSQKTQTQTTVGGQFQAGLAVWQDYWFTPVDLQILSFVCSFLTKINTLLKKKVAYKSPFPDGLDHLNCRALWEYPYTAWLLVWLLKSCAAALNLQAPALSHCGELVRLAVESWMM